MPIKKVTHTTRRNSSKLGEPSKKVELDLIGEKRDTVENEKLQMTVPKRKKTAILSIVVVILIALAGLAYFFKDKFIAATVNGNPIFRYELNQRLTSTFGKETLENLIVERLIGEEAARRNIVVNEDDVGREIEKMEESLGAGTKLEDILKYQGVSLVDFKEQLKLRLQVNRILEKEITVTQEEVGQYLKDSAKTLVATGEAEKKAEASKNIKEEKINEKIQTWISDLLAKAKITRFLK